MWSYVILLCLIAIVMLGVWRASKKQQATPRKRQREPRFMVSSSSEPQKNHSLKTESSHPQNSLSQSTHFAHEVETVTQEPMALSGLTSDEEISSEEAPNKNHHLSSKKGTLLKDTGLVVAETVSSEPHRLALESRALCKLDLIVIHIFANENRPYRGYELLQALLTLGLRYGKKGMFHCHEDRMGRGKILFNLVQAVEPGTFDLAQMGHFITPGLTLFMTTNDLNDSFMVFNHMLHTAKELQKELGGELYDEQRQPLTNEKVAWFQACLQRQNKA